MDLENRSSGEVTRKRNVYFQKPHNPLDNVCEQNNHAIEDILRSPSHACCPNQTPPPSPTPFALNRAHTLHELGTDLAQLQDRVVELEVVSREEFPGLLSDLKSQVENLRNKLEAVEVSARRVTDGYRRASDAHFTAVHLRFSQIWNREVSEDVKKSLGDPSFDTARYDDAEMLVFLQHMFQHLNLLESYQISLDVLRTFLYEVYKNYNQVPFHNFRHCFCVSQMMFAIACQVDLPGRMGLLDTLILLVSSICHDLDHPGYNNIYQINARTELALRYNDISPLENHHCSVAFRILENPHANIFSSFDKETFKEVREGIIRCILATDMARHNEILSQFKEITADFDFANRTHRNLLSMVLIKVADISNEARPLPVAEPWLEKLLTEFFQQSDLEKLEGLPVTPFMDRDKITKPSSQCSFIGFVLLPLFESLGELLPPLQELIIDPAKAALEYYKKLNDAAKDERLRRKSVIENGEEVEGIMTKSSSGLSRRSIANASVQSRQRSSADGSDVSPPTSPCPVSCSGSLSLCDDGDEETATEVEVAEKAVKFKIYTEAATPGRSTCPNSRKGSKERSQLDLEDARRKSLAFIERGARSVEPSRTRRRSSARAIDLDIEVEDKPSLLARLRSLKDKLPWVDKEEDELTRSRTLPKRRSTSRRKSRGWRAWLGKAENRSSSLDTLPNPFQSNN